MRTAEERRQAYFDNMRKYQEQNEEKQRRISGFLTEDVHSLAKKDE
jgi:hypothetical protein